MDTVRVPAESVKCRVCSKPATRVIKEFHITNAAWSDWRFYCDKHGAQPGHGLSRLPEHYFRIEEVN